MTAGIAREHLIASLLVGGVVVIMGYASGLGLRTNVTPAQASGPGQSQSQPGVGTLVPGTGLPQIPQLPTMAMPGGGLSAIPPSGTEPIVVAQPVPGSGATTTAPPVPVSTPGQPSNPSVPTTPGTPPTCTPGLAQNVVDGVGNVVGGLPVFGTVAIGLGLAGGSGALNGLLYTVTGYCAPATTAPATVLPVIAGG